MAFSGLSSNAMFTAGPLNGEDVARQIALLAISEAPVLDWVGDADGFATNTVHDFLEEELRPNYLTTSTAINSATAATGIQLADFGDLLTVGTVLENEGGTPEVMRVTSIAGAGSILVARNHDGTGVGSLAAGGQLFVREPLGIEGDDHENRDVTRKRRRKTTYCSLFRVPIAISGTQLALQPLSVGGGMAEYDRQVNMRIAECVRDLEKAVLRSVRVNSIGDASAGTYRAFAGLKTQIGSINSQVVVASFNADPHLYIGNAWQQAWNNGARATDDWGLLCGVTTYRDISNMNTTKIQDSSDVSGFRRVVRTYEGPFGQARVILSPWLAATDVLLVPRNRIKVLPLNGRSFFVKDIADTGDNKKGLVIGEYTMEVHHPQAMARIRANG